MVEGQASAPEQVPYQVRCVKMPLAVYREVASHLRQVSGVEAGLLPQTSTQFSYGQGQVEGLWVRYSESADRASHLRVEQVLTYYGDRYGAWEGIHVN